MSLRKINPVLQTVVISSITSILVTGIFFILYFYKISPSVKVDSAITSKTLPKDTQFTKYETIINEFLDTIRKGQIEAAYKSTSAVFQKKTTIDDFKKLAEAFKLSNSLPSSGCSLTEYSEPVSSSIEGLPDNFMIVQTKCEAAENGQIKGFNVELIEDKGQPKISFIKPYILPITHKK